MGAGSATQNQINILLKWSVFQGKKKNLVFFSGFIEVLEYLSQIQPHLLLCIYNGLSDLLFKSQDV